MAYYYPKQAVLVMDPAKAAPASVDRIIHHYQATRLVRSIEEVEPTWALNKVPILLGTEEDLVSRKQEVQGKYKFINIPESAASFDLNTGSDPFIKFCHGKGVDCGEYITGKRYCGGVDECFLCRIAKGFGLGGKNRVNFNINVKKASDMVLYETKHFIVKVEFGNFKVGMLMICTKDHFMSAASIPDDKFQEYLQICRDMEKLLNKIYGGPVVFFEHGSAPDGGSSHARSIVHQHTHVIAGIRMEMEDLKRVGMRPINDIREVRGKKYLSYQEGVDGQLWVADNPETYIPRQYPRKVFACMLGISDEESNWRVAPFWENIYQTFDDIHGYLEKHWDNLPKRIQNAMSAFYIAYPHRKKKLE